VDAVERVVGGSVCVFFDLSARPLAMMEEDSLFVHFDTNGHVSVRYDFEALVVVKLDEFVVGDMAAFAIVKTEEYAVFVMTERFNFDAGQFVNVDVVGMAVDIDGDGRVHDAPFSESAAMCGAFISRSCRPNET
jgi:hypothetical protein